MANQRAEDGTKATVAQNTFTREGYVFTGWNTKADGSGTPYAENGEIPSQEKGTAITLYAQWKNGTYTVAYDPNGGLGDMAPQTTNVGTDTTIPANLFTKEGYTFAGWNTKPDGRGTAYDAESTVSSREKDTTVTLYAQWQKDSYFVVYHANDGSDNIARQTTEVGTDTTILANQFARKNYTFTSWNTKADGTGTKYVAGDIMTSIEKDATITLYAQWEKVSKAALPKITKNNVRSKEVVIQGGNATTISVTAEVTDGGALSYQWYKNSKNATTGGTPINAADRPSYTPSTGTIGTLYYYVVVTNTVEIDGQPVSASNTCGIREEIVIPRPPEIYDITAETGSVLEDVTLDIIKAKQYEDYKGKITASPGYILPSTIVVTVGGKILVAGTDYIYDKETGSLVIYNVTAQPTVKAKGVLIPPTIYTISFNTNGGSTVDPISGKYGSKVTLPNAPTKGSDHFAGWYKDSSFTTSYTENKFNEENITLYAKWGKTTFEIEGTVIDEDEAVVKNATVKLMAGSRQVTAPVTTDRDGKFTIIGVPAGTYNIVITKGGQTVTQVITVSTSDITIGTITLPKGNTNSIVHVKSNTPDIVVDKLDEFFKEDPQFTQDDKNVADSGGTVEIKLDVEKKDESGDNKAANVEDIQTKATSSKKEIGIFLDLTVNKIVTPEVNGDSERPLKLSELENVLILNIPLPTELQGKNNYVIYRYHGSEVQTITQTANNDGEYIEVSSDKKSIILHTKKFSTYAIAYDPATSGGGGSGDNGGSGGSGGNGGNGGGGNGGSSGAKLPTITTTEVKEGGKITISKDNKEVTIIPDAGYVIADVMVDGKSVGARSKVTFTDSKEHHIGATFIKKIALPYYMEDGKRVYIGFSVLASDHYDYIAPPGEIVEFRDNPKDFIDNTIAWAKPSIDFVTEREIFVGTHPQVFAPNEGMTRGMFVTVIGRLYERSYAKITGENTFSDVRPDDYYVRYVGWAHENGIITGIGENKFAPQAIVTREQMGAIMRNFAAFMGKANVPETTLAYTDSKQISEWAIPGAKYCQETQVIVGRDGGNFVPQGRATRAEVAAVIERFVKVIVK